MNPIIIQLAGVNIGIYLRNSLLQECFEEFVVDATYEYEVRTSEQRLDSERELLARRFPNMRFNDVDIERNALYRDISQILLKENVLMIHGVLINHCDEGYLFTAPSGTGKSTHANLWLQEFPKTTSIINGDKPLLKLTDEGVIAYGSPWKGKENIGSNEEIKLKNVCRLTRGIDNTIKSLEWNGYTLSWMLAQSNIPGYKNNFRKRIDWLNNAAHFLNFFELKCNQNNDAAVVSRHGMNGKI